MPGRLERFPAKAAGHFRARRAGPARWLRLVPPEQHLVSAPPCDVFPRVQVCFHFFRQCFLISRVHVFAL